MMDTDKILRVMIMDSLVAQSGKPLFPELIGQLTSEILERVIDVMGRDSD